MGELLSQDDLNALLGGSSEEQQTTPIKEATIAGADIASLLSQDDLNALFATESSDTQQAPQRQEATIVGVDMGSLLSQDDLNALLGGAPETKTATSTQKIAAVEMPVTESTGESMSQDEIDDLLRQFDRNI
jgi:flagellar motor switch protein FliM